MNYEKLYKEARERAFKYIDDDRATHTKPFAEYIFPELKYSYDERMLIALIGIVGRTNSDIIDEEDVYREDLRRWLEDSLKGIKLRKLRKYVFTPYAGCDIDTAAKQAVEQQRAGENIVLDFNGIYIPVEEKTADEIVNEYYSRIKMFKKQQDERTTDNR